jgi:hypothetical protein
MTKREYVISITVNGLFINKVIIDSHYEDKHSESISDDIILKLVFLLNGEDIEPDDSSNPNYTYFVNDKMLLEGKLYKLIWLLEKDQIYIGVVNAHRSK